MKMLKAVVLPFKYYKYLLFQLTQKEIKARYKQSLVGYAWVLLNPLLQLAIYTFVFSYIFQAPSQNVPYSLYLLAGLLPWLFFQASVTAATNSLVTNSSLLTKVNFPREVIPYSAVIAKVLDLIVSFIIFFILGTIVSYTFSITSLLFPILFFFYFIFTIGISLLFSVANLFYRDFQYLINLILMLWMYMTPIVYPLSLVPERFYDVYTLNPLVGFIVTYRSILFGLPTDYKLLAWSIFSSILVYLVGFLVFKKLENVFSDIV